MMFRAAFLMYLVAVGVSSVAAEDNTLPDVLAYKCEPSSPDNDVSKYKIEIERKSPPLNTFEGIYAFHGEKNDVQPCQSSKNPQTNSFEISGCWNVNVTVIISKEEDKIGGKLSKLYMIKCVGPYNGTNVMINASKSVDYQGLANVHIQNTLYDVLFDMYITDMSDSMKTTYVIGDTMKLSINVSKVLSLMHWKVTKCTAHAGQDFDFYNGNSFSLPSYIAAPYNGYTAGALDNFRATLYAFHGKLSTTVTYECSIAVCRGVNTGNSCTIPSRRRRSPENSHIVTKTIYVLDRFEEINQTRDSGAFGNRGSPFVKILAFALGLMWMLK